MIYPIHPKAKKNLEIFGLELDALRLVEPLDYLAFLQLECNARLVLTDSGGVQEEACILGVSCVTLRCNTERSETLEVGANVLPGTKPYEFVDKAKLMVDRHNNWKNPFGDGKTGCRILETLHTHAHR